MADEKKDKSGESTGEKKKNSASGGRKGFFQSFMEPFFDQITTEYTRPILKNISPSVLSGLKKIGVNKVLPILGVVLSGLLQQKETWWGERVGDVIAESTAELRRLIDESGEGETTISGSTKESEKTKKGLLNILLNPELADELKDLLKALTDMFLNEDGENKISEKERNELLAALNSMGLQVVDFLSLEDAQRQVLLNIFFAKAEEKTLEESIAKLKAEIQKTKAHLKVIKNEVLVPACKKFEQNRTAQVVMTTLADKMRARITEIGGNQTIEDYSI